MQSLHTMSSPTVHRIFTTSTVTVVTIIILLTLYNLRDTRLASNHPLVQLPGEEKEIGRVSTYDATESTFSLLDGNKQDTVEIPAKEVSSSATSAVAATLAVNVTLPPVTAATSNEPKRAFVTFLEADTGTNRGDQAEGTNPDNEDIYFVGMVM